MNQWRPNFILFLLFLFQAALLGRLVFLQILDHGFYKALAQGQQNIVSFGKGERGMVFLRDREGALQPLAANQRVPFAFASPAEVKEPERTAGIVAEILQIDAQETTQKLNRSHSLFELLKKRLTPEEQQKLQDLKIPGIYVDQEQMRSYPYGEVASHVIGFTNQDGEGQYGVEGYFNEVLEGREGIRRSAQNPATYLLSALKETLRDGSNLVLTLDPNIQATAERILDKAVKNLGAREGTVIVMNPSSGEVLAMANAPRFHPAEYASVKDLRIFQNSAVQKLYEPGSIFKPITMVAAIDAGAVSPFSTYVDTGMVQIGGRKVYNYGQRTWGERTMTEVLELSINTGAVFAERQLGHDKFLAYLQKFGIFEPTGIELAGEVYSNNTEFKKGYEINFATASFGQGIEMTPMQIMRAFSAIANQGVLAPPSVVKENKSNRQPEQIISPRSASEITTMLASVVENGYGKAARIPGYHVAGKTGTAQISWSALGVAKPGYSEETVHSFIGYVPAFNPKFLALVKLDNPAANTAEYSAVPVFRDLAKYIIDYYQIPPDYEVE